MSKRIFSLLLVITICVSIFALPASASEPDTGDLGLPSEISEEEGKGFIYETGSFEARNHTEIVKHDLGYVPDIFIVSIGGLPENGSLFYAIGFSQAMTNSFNVENPSFSYYLGKYGAAAIRSNMGFETSSSYADQYGFIRSVNSQYFTVGGTVATLTTTGFEGSVFDPETITSTKYNFCYYNWIAISGIIDYEGSGEVPEHNFTSSLISPSCDTEGKTSYTCSDCGYTYFDQVVPALGHAYAEGICTRCGQSETPAEVHSYTSTIVLPTCEKDGMTTHTCSDCGYLYADEFVSALGHIYEEGKCTRCGESDSSYVPERPPETTDSTIPEDTDLPPSSSPSGGGEGGSGGSGGSGGYVTSDEDKTILLKGLGILGVFVFLALILIPNPGRRSQ